MGDAERPLEFMWRAVTAMLTPSPRCPLLRVDAGVAAVLVVSCKPDDDEDDDDGS